MELDNKQKYLLKIKLGIKTYLLLNQEATSKELAIFINRTYRMNTGVTYHKVSQILNVECKNKTRGRVLQGLEKFTKNSKVYYKLGSGGSV